MKHWLFLVILLPLLVLAAVPAGSAQTPKYALDAEQLNALHSLIKPGPDEARWAEIPWMPSTDIWAARQKASKEGKPLFLWYMAGEPLGSC
jgi:hypothetical protein